ncbi:MAG: ABC transporter permease, partial [Burkholderiales bacterium]|nr:ABC transporter permease [Burkholderiales bacterium]
TGGHLQIQHRDYFLYGSGNPTAYGITDYAALLDEIRKDPELGPMVAVATPMLRFGGLAGNFDAGISRTIIGTGYVADDVDKMRQWNEYQVPVVRPQFPLVGTGADSAIVGVGVARVLQLCAKLHIADCPSPESETAAAAPATRGAGKKPAELPADIAALAGSEQASRPAAASRPGARIELLSSSSNGAPNVASLNVVAAEDQGFKELDEISVIAHLAQAQKLVFGREVPRVTAIMVLLHKTADEARAQARLTALLAPHLSPRQPLVVRSFNELNPFYVQSDKMFDVIFNFIFVLIGGIVLFTVSNTMNTAVVERTVEIGTLRAVGLRQGGIRRLFIMEGFVLGCVGAVTGILAALLLGAVVNHSGLTWLPPGSSEHLPLQLRVLGDMKTVLFTTLGLVMIATASAWLPAWRAANLKVVEALRHA